MIKYIIFDLDGTLLDTLTTITYYVNLILKREGIREISEDECKDFIGNGAKTLIRRALLSRNIDDEVISYNVWKDYNAEYNKNTLYLTEPFSGIRELLSNLKEKEIKLAVLSNKPDDTTVDIIEKIFPGVFDIVHGGRDGIPLKPAPDGVFALCREIGAPISEVMFVGDTHVDIQTGKNSGVAKTVGVSWGYRDVASLIENGADVIVNTADEILREALN